MAKLVFSNLISLDGYCAGPGGDLGRLPMGTVFDDHNLELLREAGTLLFGRITFGMFQGYWPRVRKDPSAGPAQAEIADPTGRIHKLVVSDTLSLPADAPWGDAEVVRRAQAHARIRALKTSTGRDLLAYGSHVLMNATCWSTAWSTNCACWWATWCWGRVCAPSKPACVHPSR